MFFIVKYDSRIHPLNTEYYNGSVRFKVNACYPLSSIENIKTWVFNIDLY